MKRVHVAKTVTQKQTAGLLMVLSLALVTIVGTGHAQEKQRPESVFRQAEIIYRLGDVVKKTSESENKATTMMQKTAEHVAHFEANAACYAVAQTAIVTTVQAVGVKAGTGTAISALGGAAATSATLAYVGAPVAAGITAVTGIAVAPAVAGVAVVGATAYGIKRLGSWGWDQLSSLWR